MGGGIGGGFSVSNLIQDVGVYEKNASSVREYAYTEDKNFRYRPSMEDSKLSQACQMLTTNYSLCNQR
jgi:hypothetical protein